MGRVYNPGVALDEVLDWIDRKYTSEMYPSRFDFLGRWSRQAKGPIARTLAAIGVGGLLCHVAQDWNWLYFAGSVVAGIQMIREGHYRYEQYVARRSAEDGAELEIVMMKATGFEPEKPSNPVDKYEMLQEHTLREDDSFWYDVGTSVVVSGLVSLVAIGAEMLYNVMVLGETFTDMKHNWTLSMVSYVLTTTTVGYNFLKHSMLDHVLYAVKLGESELEFGMHTLDRYQYDYPVHSTRKSTLIDLVSTGSCFETDLPMWYISQFIGDLGSNYYSVHFDEDDEELVELPLRDMSLGSLFRAYALSERVEYLVALLCMYGETDKLGMSYLLADVSSHTPNFKALSWVVAMSRGDVAFAQQHIGELKSVVEESDTLPAVQSTVVSMHGTASEYVVKIHDSSSMNLFELALSYRMGQDRLGYGCAVANAKLEDGTHVGVYLKHEGLSLDEAIRNSPVEILPIDVIYGHMLNALDKFNESIGRYVDVTEDDYIDASIIHPVSIDGYDIEHRFERERLVSSFLTRAILGRSRLRFDMGPGFSAVEKVTSEIFETVQRGEIGNIAWGLSHGDPSYTNWMVFDLEELAEIDEIRTEPISIDYRISYVPHGSDYARMLYGPCGKLSPDKINAMISLYFERMGCNADNMSDLSQYAWILLLERGMEVVGGFFEYRYQHSRSLAWQETRSLLRHVASMSPYAGTYIDFFDRSPPFLEPASN